MPETARWRLVAPAQSVARPAPSDASSATRRSSHRVRRPFVRSERGRADRARPLRQSLVSVTDPVNGTGQSTPVMLPSMLRVSAVAKLAKVPRHPRGDVYSPCVLIWAGGVFPGIIDVDDVNVIGNQLFSERIVVRNDCRF